MIVKVMIGLAALLSAILVVAATKPKTFRIQRSTSIDAPPESVFVLIDDLPQLGSVGAPGQGRCEYEENLQRTRTRRRCGFRMDWFRWLGQRTLVDNGLAAVNEDFDSGGLGEAVCRPQP